jgi:hypothetical protein
MQGSPGLCRPELSNECLGIPDQFRRRLDDEGENRVESNSPPLREGARIRQISEDESKILFECEDESTLDVTIVDPGNSVIVRDENNQVEYLG